MALESSVNYISDLVPANPTSGDPRSEGDDHLRNIKRALKGTFPNVIGEASCTQSELNYLLGLTGNVQTAINSKAPAASPAFTGTATAVNLTVSGTTSLSTATTIGAVSYTELSYLDGVTAAIQPQIAAKAPIVSPVFTGFASATTPPSSDKSTKLATTNFIHAVAGALSCTADGTILNSVGPSGFTVTHTGTGLYKITHPFGISYCVVGQARKPAGATARFFHMVVNDSSEATNIINIETYALNSGSASGALADLPFMLLFREFP